MVSGTDVGITQRLLPVDGSAELREARAFFEAGCCLCGIIWRQYILLNMCMHTRTHTHTIYMYIYIYIYTHTRLLWFLSEGGGKKSDMRSGGSEALGMRFEQEQWAELEPLNSFIHIHLGFRGEVGSWMIRWAKAKG